MITYTSKESSEQVELEFLSKSIGSCMKNERFGPDSDRHSDRRLSLPAQRQLNSISERPVKFKIWAIRLNVIKLKLTI